MKKKNPKQKAQKNSIDIITVHSRTYGEHTRAARCSFTPARLNDVLARRSKELGVITGFASEVHSLLPIALPTVCLVPALTFIKCDFPNTVLIAKCFYTNTGFCKLIKQFTYLLAASPYASRT